MGSLIPQAELDRSDPFDLTGATFRNRYLLKTVIGLGQFGVVYKAFDIVGDLNIAVKLIRPDVLELQVDRSRVVRMFEREASLLRGLSHKNILRVLDYGVGEFPFMVLEWLNGHTLSEELRVFGPLSVARTAVILKQICSALAYAHRHDIVHLDIKPSNVFLLDHVPEAERVKVIDFGFARSLESGVKLDLTQYLGTPGYSAPEIEESKASALSDIYSLGVTTREMLTGVPPVGANNRAKTSIGRRSPSIPPLINELLAQATQVNLNSRLKDAESFYRNFGLAIKEAPTLPDYFPHATKAQIFFYQIKFLIWTMLEFLFTPSRTLFGWFILLFGLFLMLKTSYSMIATEFLTTTGHSFKISEGIPVSVPRLHPRVTRDFRFFG